MGILAELQALPGLLRRACFLKRTLGTRCAAGYLRNRGVCLEAALIGLGFPVRFPPQR